MIPIDRISRIDPLISRYIMLPCSELGRWRVCATIRFKCGSNALSRNRNNANAPGCLFFLSRLLGDTSTRTRRITAFQSHGKIEKKPDSSVGEVPYRQIVERASDVPVEMPYSNLDGKAGLAKVNLAYKRKVYFFSKAEKSFYEVLRFAIQDEFALFAKVRLSDLLYNSESGSERVILQNKIQSKHADFVLCDPTYLKPLLVIELDDSSHDRPSRQSRDTFVDEALGAAGLPILHVRVQNSYSIRELSDKIRSLLTPPDPDARFRKP